MVQEFLFNKKTINNFSKDQIKKYFKKYNLKIKKNMKVVILAGGFGTRLSEYTRTIPKPMISICGKPIITYIIKHYEKFGFREFIIATGYKKYY